MDEIRGKFELTNRVIETQHNDPLVISVRLNRYNVRRVLEDTGTSVNLLTLEVFNKLGLDKNNLTKVSYPLVGLGDKTIAMLGTINLSLVLVDKKHNRELYAEFAVVDIPFAYNVMIDLPILNYH